MKTFIRAAEVWLPTADQAELTHGGGLSGPEARAFGAFSQSVRFRHGEGLPGLAWAEGRPLRCAIALPVFVREALTAVLVFFCGDDDEQAGAIELWRNDPRVTTDMTLVDGFYSHSASALEAVSQDTYLPRGTGLPGLAWQQGRAVFMEDLASAPRFLRGETASGAGIERGLALPWPARTQAEYVVTLLSSSRTPVARRVEGWAPGDDPRVLQRGFGFDETEGHLGDAALALDADAGPIGAAYASGVPQVAVQSPEGRGQLVVIPVVSEGVVAEVVALYL